ncbi:tetratricopeptide repeat protein [bacterium]|nr:tetratricopeptide repeat protein [bacterium]
MKNTLDKKKVASHTLLIIIFISLGFISITQQLIKRQYKKGTLRDYPILFRSPEILKGLSFNFSEIFADLIWVRCIRYIYHHYHIDNKFPYLYDFLNQIVTLSPKFIDVYRLGAENLLMAAGDTDGAIELIKKGITHNPNEWILYYKLGQCYHLGKNDQEKAIYYYHVASMIPGSPPFLSDITAKMKSQTNENEIIYEIWEDIYKTTTMKNLKLIAKEKMFHTAVRMDQPLD